MNDQLTATIIPFPVRTRHVQVEQAVMIETPTAPAPKRQQTNELAQSSQRLSDALAGLSAALAEQKDATQRWKAAIEDLATKMRTLGDVGALRKKIS